MPTIRLTGDYDDDVHQPQGFLIDFDYAIVKDLQVSDAHHRTGTAMFMAVSILSGGLNTYRSDLESFYCVLCYICTHYPDSEELQKSRECEKEAKTNGYDQNSKGSFSAPRSYDIEALGPLAEWVVGDQATIMSRKLAIMLLKKQFEEAVLEHVTPIYVPAKPMPKNLREAIVGSEWFMSNNVHERQRQAREDEMKWIQRGKPPGRRIHLSKSVRRSWVRTTRMRMRFMKR